MSEGGQEKVTKSSVHYRFMGDVSERCGNCAMFKDWQCTLVRGTIIPLMVCDQWEAKSAQPPQSA